MSRVAAVHCDRCRTSADVALLRRRSNNYGGGGGMNVWISPTDFFFFTVSICLAALMQHAVPSMYRHAATCKVSLRESAGVTFCRDIASCTTAKIHNWHASCGNDMTIVRAQDPYYMRRRRYAYGYQGNAMQVLFKIKFC